MESSMSDFRGIAHDIHKFNTYATYKH